MRQPADRIDPYRASTSASRSTACTRRRLSRVRAGSRRDGDAVDYREGTDVAARTCASCPACASSATSRSSAASRRQDPVELVHEHRQRDRRPAQRVDRAPGRAAPRRAALGLRGGLDQQIEGPRSTRRATTSRSSRSSSSSSSGGVRSNRLPRLRRTRAVPQVDRRRCSRRSIRCGPTSPRSSESPSAARSASPRAVASWRS